MTGDQGRPAAGKVLVIGDVVDDVLVQPLSRFTPDSDTSSQIRFSPGGSAANQAAWLGWHGVPVRFIARVGAVDVERHSEQLRRFGVEALLAGDPDVATGTIVVVLGAHDTRTMFSDRGANLRLAAEDIPPNALDDIALLHVNGYTLFDPNMRKTVLGVLREARRRDIRVSVDPCSVAFLEDVGPDEFLRWTAGAAVCLPNRDEGAALTGWSDPFDIAKALTEHYGMVTLKLGADGVLTATPGSEPVLLPAGTRNAIDTTGAGDAFCAGFLAAWLRGAAPVEAARAGSDAAALGVTIVGGRPRATG